MVNSDLKQRRSAPSGRKRRPAAQIVARLTMVGISLLLVSAAHATRSITSPRTPALIAAPTERSKTGGPSTSRRDGRSSSRLFRIIAAHPLARAASPSSGTLMASALNKASQMRNEERPVIEDKFEKIGPIMNEIGAEAAEIVGGDPDGLYIYAEPAPGTVFAAVFKDEGMSVRYYSPTEQLFELILEAWETESKNEGLRWAVLEYEVQDMKFHVELTYPEELDPNEDAMDRRQAALKKRYGDKPVIYPPVPEHLQGLSRD
jgi:hypothetical protein